MVLLNDPETGAHGMEIQVLSHGMMVVLVLRRVLLIGAVNRTVVMAGLRVMRLMRRMRLGMNNFDVPVWRDLQQVRQGQGQDQARPEHARQSGERDFHSPDRLAPVSLSVNVAGLCFPCCRTISL